MDNKTIIIVSGLPRSGTSMLMSMLEKGGIEVLTDRERKADEDNPRGYFEFERVKQIEEDNEWLKDACGKVVKMISALLSHLPDNYNYKVIFMERKMEEILASQRQMLIRRGEPTDKISDDEMAKLFKKHLEQVKAWLAQKANFDVLYVSYNDILENPQENAEKINRFLGGNLRIDNMVDVIDKSLYRQRK
jgi:hypothetical protein